MFSSNLAYKTDSYLKKLISSSSLVQFASQNSLAVKRIHNIIFCWNVNTSCVFSYSKFFVVESFVTAFLYHCPNFVDWERFFLLWGWGRFLCLCFWFFISLSKLCRLGKNFFLWGWGRFLCLCFWFFLPFFELDQDPSNLFHVKMRLWYSILQYIFSVISEAPSKCSNSGRWQHFPRLYRYSIGHAGFTRQKVVPSIFILIILQEVVPHFI